MSRTMFPAMELRHLRYFVAVAEALSFTKAAENQSNVEPVLNSVGFCVVPRLCLAGRAWPERVLRVRHEEGGICHAVLLQDDAGVRA